MVAQSSNEILALDLVLTALALLFVVLRIYAHGLRKIPLMPDDYLVIGAMILMIPCLTIPTIIMCVKYNLGNHIQVPSDGHPEPPAFGFNLWELVLHVAGYIPIGIAKIAILLFYRRVFRGSIKNKVFSFTIWSLIGLIAAWTIGFGIASALQCVPVSLSLHEPPNGPGLKCINAMKLFYTGAILDVGADLAILIIPFPLIWALQLSTKNKFAVVGIFVLGASTIAVSTVRVVEFVNAGNLQQAGDMDYTYYIARPVLITVIEGSMSIICACMPTLRPLIDRSAIKTAVRSILSRTPKSNQSRRVSRTWNKHTSRPSSPRSSSVEQLGGASFGERPMTSTKTTVEAQGIPLDSYDGSTLEPPRKAIVIQQEWSRNEGYNMV